ncbi:type I-E CRISPR-associated protein Cse1/CasA [Nissabacter archeti]|uniref:Type I-E CRISPR-associated protein Cse1/CasA n=1 Tax=Nissabacter archeti TaxID=1917880 RepID=A0ABS5JL45_9GAMM|nr:type I-E CRISPR-associated protein Cse1/CasA [Nissabacter archeti]
MWSLLTTAWLPARFKDGRLGKIAPSQLADKNIIDIAAPRADLQGAAWQFLIGLLQTARPPEDSEEWEDIWHDGLTEQQVTEAFARLEHAFQFGPASPSFMQDIEPLKGDPIAIGQLLVEAPGAQTTKFNKDHFVKRGTLEKLCPHCAALALFALQTNAPSGGQGYRTGLRGGGPITTLLELKHTDATRDYPLWRKLWLNVMPQPQDETPAYDARIFPWLAPTRTSEKASGITTPTDSHVLQAYWGMPRRFRIDFANTVEGDCDLCGEHHPALLQQITAKNYGVQYVGWRHPLTPYRRPKKEGGELFSLKGQPGGLVYRDWLGLMHTTHSENNEEYPAEVVTAYQSHKLREPGIRVGLWGFGYDFDNMKARCWYEHHTPLLMLTDEQWQQLQAPIQRAVANATRQLSFLKSALKEAWFDNPKEARGDFSFIDVDFWHQTEPCFTELLDNITSDADSPLTTKQREEITVQEKAWQRYLRRFAMNYFDEHVFTHPEQNKLSRIMKARKKYFVLEKKPSTGKKKQEATA